MREEGVWKEFGKLVAACKKYFPGSFDRPPRNPAEKMNSGYKAWEFLLLFYCLGPCLFAFLLPRKYWRHYCLEVGAFRLLMQEEILAMELIEAQESIMKWANDFEKDLL